ncbi:MAG: PAS domain-containing sensor histidine kinase, partial [Roseibium sp.]
MRRLARITASKTGKTTLTGHLRLLAQPTYQRLLRSEPLMRRIIPALCLIFIACLAIYRVLELSYDYQDTERQARDEIALTATVVSSHLAHEESRLPELGYRSALQRILADSLPAGATSHGRTFLVADKDGLIVASAPLRPMLEGLPITDLFGASQPLTVFGARAGVMAVPATIGNETVETFATVHH